MVHRRNRYVYDSVMSRLRSSGQIGVNDLAATTKAQCTGGVGSRSRMLCFDVILAGLYGWGVLPTFRAAKLYDQADPDAQAIVATVKGWTDFYREFTKMRPSGAPGILLSDMVHIRRPDARGIEAVVSVSADASAPARAIFSVLNPTLATVLAANVSVPLYATNSPRPLRSLLYPRSLIRCTDPLRKGGSAHPISILSVR